MHKLYTGCLACERIEEIGPEIDFCFIDTSHINPGEILDFLMVFPFLSENALVVFHDINLHTIRYPYLLKIEPYATWSAEWSSYAITTNLLISSIYGDKIIVNDFIKRQDDKIFFGNIAGIRINKETKNHLFEIFNLLTIKWQYRISEENKNKILAFFRKYYDSFYIDYLSSLFDYHNLCFEYEKIKGQIEQEKYISLLNEVKSLKESNSWKITAPLRFLRRILKGKMT